MRRSGQLQTLEPVLVIIFLGILLGVGILVYARLGDFQSSQQATLMQEREALALLKQLTTLPELSCPTAITVQTFCIDAAKARQFSQHVLLEMNRTYYYPLLGASEISLEWFDLDADTTQSLTLYNATIGNRTLLGSGTFFTVYDPVQDARSFAILTVRREFG